MKNMRLLALLISMLFLFCFVGCELADTSDATKPDRTTTVVDSEMDTEAPSDTDAETVLETNFVTTPEESEHETVASTEDSESDSNKAPGSDSLTATGYFESFCEADRLHNMITATYTGYTMDRNNCFALSFQVHELHVGLDVGDTVKAVYYPPDDVNSTDPKDIIFTEGETYLILLTRYRSVYENGDTYQVVGRNMLIPANDFPSSTLYGTPLANHVAGMDVTESTTIEQFISYIQSITTENEQFSGQDYIQSNARVDIMTASPHVVTVTTESVTSSMSTVTVTLRFRVDSVQKGSLTAGESIDIMFPLDANVGLNETFIMTLNDPLPGGMNWYMFSCKQAMYPISETDSIMEIIQNEQASK